MALHCEGPSSCKCYSSALNAEHMSYIYFSPEFNQLNLARLLELAQIISSIIACQSGTIVIMNTTHQILNVKPNIDFKKGRI